jgi:predicted solute-binding protein
MAGETPPERHRAAMTEETPSDRTRATLTGEAARRRNVGPHRVARIPYLNVAPFFLGWNDLPARSDGCWTTSEAPPRALGEAAERGELDAAVFAEADLHRLRADFVPLTLRPGDRQLGVASHDRVGSVFLFIRDPERAGEPAPVQGTPGRILSDAEAANLHGARILLTGESSTSVRLVRLLLEVRHGVRPGVWERADLVAPTSLDPAGSHTPSTLPDLPADVQAALVIGDTALRWSRRAPAGFAVGMDLAAAWHEWTGLPFVFARWGVRRSVPAPARDRLAQYLEASLVEAEASLETVAQGHAPELGPPGELAAYLSGFTYRLGPEELAGAERFHALLGKHGITAPT